jgi:hypothetical protein
VGYNALTANTTATYNTAVGYIAGQATTTGVQNTVVGAFALENNTTGASNVAIGLSSLKTNTTANDNVGVGQHSLRLNTTGASNTAIGGSALFNNTTASYNTAVGYQALTANTTASNNTAVGYNSLYSNTTAGENTAIGQYSMRFNTTGFGNAACGGSSLYSNTTGILNQCFGYTAGSAITTGSKNTILGAYSGNQGGLDIRTASNHIVLSDGDGNPRGIFDNSGNFLVGKTSTDIADEGVAIKPTNSGGGVIFATSTEERVAVLNRTNTNGEIISFRVDNAVIGTIGTPGNNDMYVASGNIGLLYSGSGTIDIYPCDDNGSGRDNVADFGQAGARWDDIYATNGTIVTSDKNEKQDIEELSDAEQRVAVVAKGLMRKFRWKDKVAEKGDNARTHFGIIAQDLQDAFTAEGLDAGDYAMFTSTTWWEKEISVDAVEADEENGIEGKDAYIYIDRKNEATDSYTEKTRLGVRYNQLLAFIISAI